MNNNEDLLRIDLKITPFILIEKKKIIKLPYFKKLFDG